MKFYINFTLHNYIERKRQRDEACGSPGLDTSSSSVESEDDVVELGLAVDDRSKKAKHPKGMHMEVFVLELLTFHYYNYVMLYLCR